MAGQDLFRSVLLCVLASAFAAAVVVVVVIIIIIIQQLLSDITNRHDQFHGSIGMNRGDQTRLGFVVVLFDDVDLSYARHGAEPRVKTTLIAQEIG